MWERYLVACLLLAQCLNECGVGAVQYWYSGREEPGPRMVFCGGIACSNLTNSTVNDKKLLITNIPVFPGERSKSPAE